MSGLELAQRTAALALVKFERKLVSIFGHYLYYSFSLAHLLVRIP